MLYAIERLARVEQENGNGKILKHFPNSLNRPIQIGITEGIV